LSTGLLLPPIHRGRWEATSSAVGDHEEWVPLLPDDVPLQPDAVLVHLGLDWAVCQNHDPCTRPLVSSSSSSSQPDRGLGYLHVCAYTPRHHVSPEAASGLASTADGSQTPAVDWSSLPGLQMSTEPAAGTPHPLAIAADCLFGLRPGAQQDASMLSAIQEWAQFRFRLAGVARSSAPAAAERARCRLARPAVYDWLPLAQRPMPLAAAGTGVGGATSAVTQLLAHQRALRRPHLQSLHGWRQAHPQARPKRLVIESPWLPIASEFQCF
jgi:hypothetical protein